MRSILLLNAKGGCGKTTLATNLASYYADAGYNVALADFDPQASSLDWAEARPANRPPIHAIAAFRSGLRVPGDTDYLIMDAPASTHGKTLPGLLRRAESVIVPVLPSPIDIRAASRFIDELTRLSRIVNRQARIATVANRLRENTNAGFDLQEFLDSQKLDRRHKIPFITFLRQSQNYVRAAERGLGIFELGPAATAYDREQWTPMLRWLASERSLPV